ncbi:hypothetical protein [Actinophytocola oryzae]|uniref:hypothetical protein n=1 Tax=Actinophytocola oryzae TaxID=502181 RepID=UPI00312C8ADC
MLSLVACVGLALWQWQRFENGGTWQNLGYVLQWPLFGLFPGFMFWRMRKLRSEQARAETRPAPVPATANAAAVERAESHAPPPTTTVTPSVRHHAVDDDPELAAYNSYLARLNALDQQETR